MMPSPASSVVPVDEDDDATKPAVLMEKARLNLQELTAAADSGLDIPLAVVEQACGTNIPFLVQEQRSPAIVDNIGEQVSEYPSAPGKTIYGIGDGPSLEEMESLPGKASQEAEVRDVGEKTVGSTCDKGGSGPGELDDSPENVLARETRYSDQTTVESTCDATCGDFLVSVLPNDGQIDVAMVADDAPVVDREHAAEATNDERKSERHLLLACPGEDGDHRTGEGVGVPAPESPSTTPAESNADESSSLTVECREAKLRDSEGNPRGRKETSPDGNENVNYDLRQDFATDHSEEDLVDPRQGLPPAEIAVQDNPRDSNDDDRYASTPHSPTGPLGANTQPRCVEHAGDTHADVQKYECESTMKDNTSGSNAGDKNNSAEILQDDRDDAQMHVESVPVLMAPTTAMSDTNILSRLMLAEDDSSSDTMKHRHDPDTAAESDAMVLSQILAVPAKDESSSGTVEHENHVDGSSKVVQSDDKHSAINKHGNHDGSSTARTCSRSAGSHQSGSDNLGGYSEGDSDGSFECLSSSDSLSKSEHSAEEGSLSEANHDDTDTYSSEGMVSGASSDSGASDEHNTVAGSEDSEPGSASTESLVESSAPVVIAQDPEPGKAIDNNHVDGIEPSSTARSDASLAMGDGNGDYPQSLDETASTEKASDTILHTEASDGVPKVATDTGRAEIIGDINVDTVVATEAPEEISTSQEPATRDTEQLPHEIGHNSANSTAFTKTSRGDHDSSIDAAKNCGDVDCTAFPHTPNLNAVDTDVDVQDIQTRFSQMLNSFNGTSDSPAPAPPTPSEAPPLDGVSVSVAENDHKPFLLEGQDAVLCHTSPTKQV